MYLLTYIIKIEKRRPGDLGSNLKNFDRQYKLRLNYRTGNVSEKLRSPERDIPVSDVNLTLFYSD